MSPVSVDLKNWQPRIRPARTPIEGRFVRLEPLNAASHGDDLFEIATVPDAADRFRYLSEEPPESRAAFQTWLEKVQASEDPLYFCVIDKASGKAAGRQTFMRIEPAHGRIEIGHIHWGPAIARKPAATEAHYLFMRHAFEDLGYRRRMTGPPPPPPQMRRKRVELGRSWRKARDSSSK